MPVANKVSEHSIKTPFCFRCLGTDRLSPSQQSELVALMWIGRGDGEQEEWAELVKLAGERREVPTEQYLLDHPLVADDWAEALDKLGYGGMVDGVEEIKTR